MWALLLSFQILGSGDVRTVSLTLEFWVPMSLNKLLETKFLFSLATASTAGVMVLYRCDSNVTSLASNDTFTYCLSKLEWLFNLFCQFVDF